jgi:hypothetical protein
MPDLLRRVRISATCWREYRGFSKKNSRAAGNALQTAELPLPGGIGKMLT